MQFLSSCYSTITSHIRITGEVNAVLAFPEDIQADFPSIYDSAMRANALQREIKFQCGCFMFGTIGMVLGAYVTGVSRVPGTILHDLRVAHPKRFNCLRIALIVGSVLAMGFAGHNIPTTQGRFMKEWNQIRLFVINRA